MVESALVLIAVCKDSYVIHACGFDQMGKLSGFVESLESR